ncbi:hypothetical protein O9929_27320 [Vibrio lentus]|nr:hypothetical protein [Vibrio lentus]
MRFFFIDQPTSGSKEGQVEFIKHFQGLIDGVDGQINGEPRAASRSSVPTRYCPYVCKFKGL